MLLALLLVAQSPPDLSAFKPFLGACWSVHFSATMNDIHCFDAMYGDAHVRDRHEVKQDGKTIYAGETIYSVNGPDLIFVYFNSLGGVGKGKVDAQASIRFTGAMRPSPKEPEQQIDSEWRVLDADHYEVRSLVPSDSSKADRPLIFTRVAAPSN